jgi:hypothetical protein
LEYQLDYRLLLKLQTEYPRLYSWAIQELDEEGSPKSREMIPWIWSLYFNATDLKYSFQLENKKKYKQDQDNPSANVAFTTSEIISGSLKPESERRSNGRYSFFGTKRTVTDFDLRITRCSADAQESCHLWGCVSYKSEWDFEDVTQPDCVTINLQLAPDNFDKLKFLTINQDLSFFQIRLNGVSGFYSEWSPSIRTDFIKILANVDDQKLEIPENSTVSPRVLGEVSEFFLTMGDMKKFAKIGDKDCALGLEDKSPEDDKDEAFRFGGEKDRILNALEPQIFDLRSKRKLQRAIHSIAVAAWILVGLVFLHFISRHF